VGDFWIDAWWTLVRETGFPVVIPGADPDAFDDTQFYGFYGGYALAPTHSLEFLVFRDIAKFNPAPAGQLQYLDTLFGLRLHGDVSDFDYDLELGYQTGSRDGFAFEPASRLSIEANALAALVGYTFRDVPWTPRIALEYERATGDDDPNDDEDNSFLVMYEYAFGYTSMMTHWKNIDKWTLILTAKPVDKMIIGLELSTMNLESAEDAWYSLVEAPVFPAPGASKDLGTEVNFHLQYSFAKRTWMRLGYANFKPGQFSADTIGTRDHMDSVQIVFDVGF
jgi:alginate export protein